MKKNIFLRLGSALVVLIIGFTLTGIASAADPFSWITNPKFSGYLPNSITGGVKVKSNIQVSAISGPTYKVAVTLTLENLPVNEGPYNLNVYQAWLIDGDTGYRISIGSTIRKNNGTGTMSFTQYMSYPKVFDRLEVTKEKIFDLNPSPSQTVVYSTDLNIPVFTEVAYKTTLSSKYVFPEIAPSNKGGTGRFTIHTRNNTMKYEFKLKKIPVAQRVIGLYGPARPGTKGDLVIVLPTTINQDDLVTGEWRYEQSIDEEKLMNGEYYIQVKVGGGASDVGVARGQIVF